MCWHKTILSCLLGLLMTFPLHGNAQSIDPFRYLARGFSVIGAENMTYRSYIFVPGISSESMERITAALSGNTDVTVSSTARTDFNVIKLKSDRDYRDLLIVSEKIRFEALQSGISPNEVWNAEALIPFSRRASEEDLAALAVQLVQSLGGKQHSLEYYSGTVQLLAYLPLVNETIVLEDGPINLNLELFADSSAGGIRVRAGIPVLLSPVHFPD